VLQWAAMPWCDTCDRFLSPSTVHPDGTCPTCGRAVDAGRARVTSGPALPGPPAEPAAGTDEDEELGPIPWHLKLLGGALAVYLGYRAFQGIEWILGR
jgi:hypothetical protein